MMCPLGVRLVQMDVHSNAQQYIRLYLLCELFDFNLAESKSNSFLSIYGKWHI